MRRVLQIFGVGILLAVAGSGAEAAPRGDAAFKRAFGACGQACVIRYSPGGEVELFQAAARAVRAGAKKLVMIDGPCISACAIFADMARSRVCITERAEFGFHKARRLAVSKHPSGRRKIREIGRNDPPHSRDIARWVRRHGGFPAEGLRVMSASEAGQFWRRCAARGA